MSRGYIKNIDCILLISIKIIKNLFLGKEKLYSKFFIISVKNFKKYIY